jgi:predicted metal-binding protein
VTSGAAPSESRVEARALAPTTIFVCITCRRADDPEDVPRPGATLARLTAQAAQGSGIPVKRVRCLANCTRGLSAAVRRHDAWTYVFGGLDADADGPALVEGARLLAGADDGLMPWRGRPAALKRGLIARVPPLDFIEEETE